MKHNELKVNEPYQIFDNQIKDWRRDCEFLGYDIENETCMFRVMTKESYNFGSDYNLNGICYKFITIQHSDVFELVRENNQNPLGRDDLKLGEMYSIIDYGIDEWTPEYEYLGYDSNTGNHMFRSYDNIGFLFIGVSEDDLGSDVKFNS
jgi:hypothetical protein